MSASGNGITGLLPRRLKGFLRQSWFRLKGGLVRTFLAYDRRQLERRLAELGISPGDTVLVHAGYHPHSGCRASAGELVQVFLDLIGPEGNLMMASMAYRSSTYEYARRREVFDVRRTPSQMGLVSEAFRRRPGVLRSLNPAHPVLAWGPKAEWIVSGHDRCEHSCGENSPFAKLAELRGKILFFDVPFNRFTFIHHLEHRLRDRLPFPLYRDEAYDIPVIDAAGQPRTVRVRAFSDEAVRRRRPAILERELRRRKSLAAARIGNTRLLLVEAAAVVACATDMARRGVFFYEAG